jgi:hypothetical protein
VLLAEAKKQGIEDVGIFLSDVENRALFAIQRLLDETEYQGTEEPIALPPGNKYRLLDKLPVLRVKISDYLECYGVGKYTTRRQKTEFSGKGRAVALEALKSLAAKVHLIAYKRTTFARRRKTEERIEVLGLLIECRKVEREIEVIPAPILVDQVHDYFVLKPADLYELVSGADLRLIEYLLLQVALGNETISEAPETIARKIGLDLARSEDRQRLVKSYEKARILGFLKEYELNVPGKRVDRVDQLKLNPESVYHSGAQSLPPEDQKSTTEGHKVYHRPAEGSEKDQCLQGV